MSRSPLLALVTLAGCFDGTVTSATGEIPPPPPPPAITVSMGPADGVIAVGSSLQFQAVSSSTVAGWEWSVSEGTRASISTSGLLVAIQAGAVRIRACATNAPSVCGVADLTILTVPPSGAPVVTVEPGAASIGVGQSVEYSAMAVNFAQPSWTWSSQDPATATISAAGVVTGRRPGRAVVAACAPDAPRYCGTAVVQVQ